MDTRRTLLVDAFTDEPLAGNAAGLVPDADGLNDPQRQAVARELNASETAFLTESDDADADYRVRYFTPTTEVDLCGHATVAAGAHLHDETGDDAFAFETNVGVIDVTVEDGVVWMTQGEARAVETDEVDYEELADALGVDVNALLDVGADLPLATATTGLAFLVVPVNFLEHLGTMDPDARAVEDLCERVGATGVYAFTFDTVERDSTLHGRMFAPLAGVPEDPVTGTASGAAAAYLRRFSALDDFSEMRFEQGHFVDRAGTVHVRADDRIRVGGRAVTALDGDLSVPDIEADEILEA